MKKLWLDRETYCDLDLKEVGTARYAERAEDLLLTYALDDGEVQCWDVTEDPYCPDDLQAALEDDEVLVYAHNAWFDRMIHLYQRHLPQVRLERWRCTMAQALSHALPGKLDNLGKVLGLGEDQKKMKEGKKLIGLFTKPQPANRKIRRATRFTHPEPWETFKLYGKQDIVAMRECERRMPKWNWDEGCIAEWHLDQRINERGFHVDRELALAGKSAAETEKVRIGVRFRELTEGIVDRPSQRAQFMEFMNERYNLDLDNTQGDTFLQLLKNPKLHPDAAELMELSMAANKTSTAKYAALEPMIQDDGRFRGALQFAGASRTRRWAGRGPQYHNLPSRGLPPAAEVERYIAMLKVQSHDLFFKDLMKFGSAALRGTVIATPGKKLIAADLSNIEGRKLAWFAQEEWKLQAFRDFDAGTGPDLYKITAASILGGSPYDVNKQNRNVFGKVPDLASGYQGGVAGYQKFAHNYGVRMEDHWGTIQKQIAPELIAKAHENLESWGRPQVEELEITELEWLASETCKLAWRQRHPKTVAFWYELQRMAIAAIKNPGLKFSVMPYLHLKCVKFLDQTWLVIKLPSGRYLTYFEPHLIQAKGESKPTICYWGESSEEGKTARIWQRTFTHGGKMTGNVCQTSARDVLMRALIKAEGKGYLPVLSVHDEAITEVDDVPEFNVDGLVNILAENDVWTEGLPLAAAGFESYFYFKED
jgi:DNA polymerase